MSTDSNQSRTLPVVCRLCKSVMEELIHAVEPSTEDGHSEDLARLLGRVISVSSCSSASATCRFCLLAPMIIDIADRIQPRYDRTLEERVLLNWIRQLKAIREESTEDLPNSCRILKEQLELIVDVRGNRPTNSPSSQSAGMLDGAHDLRIEGGNITNVAGSSNLLVFIKQ
ncbi:hypothetical protein F5887DRAFT_1005090, partial [Amanita rubescens]